MLIRCSVALDNLSKTIPPIDSDQKVALLHAPFKGTTLFRGELAKLHRATRNVPVLSLYHHDCHCTSRLEEHMVQSNEGTPMPNVNVEPGNLRVTRINEGMLPPQSVPVRG